MHHFKIKLAGRVIDVTASFKDTAQLCQAYQTEEPADFVVCVSPADLAAEREKATISCSDGYLETLAVYRQIAVHMLDYDTVLFHGSVIAVDGEGYLFTAPSGTGKSTHTALWRRRFGERSFMVNDDKPLLSITDQAVVAYGTPWDGKHRLSRNIGVPLKAICLLHQAAENHIESVSARQAYSRILAQIYRPTEHPQAMLKTLQLADKLLTLPLFELGCTISEEAVQVAYTAMKGENT